jgi:hypothetical protein
MGAETKRGAFTTRIREELKTQLEEQAAAAGRSLSEEIEAILERSVDPGYGDDHGPFLCLLHEVLRVIDRDAKYLRDREFSEPMLRATIRLLHRLQAPADTHVYLDGSIEARVDELIFDVGNDGSEYHGPPSHTTRWAAGVRKHLGAFGPLLVDMRRAVRKSAETLPPGAPPRVDPASDAILGPAIEKAQAASREHLAREEQERRAREARRGRARQRRED